MLILDSFLITSIKVASSSLLSTTYPKTSKPISLDSNDNLFKLLKLFICSFLIILPKNNVGYKTQSKLTFLFGFLFLIFSETTLRYATESSLSMSIYLFAPWVFFISTYFLFYIKVKSV